MKFTLLALALALCAHDLQASLGETETDLVKRYGKITGSFKAETGRFTTDEFEYSSFHVSVTLLNGVSSREIFTRTDKTALSDKEMQAILGANTMASKWEKKDDNDTIIVWVLESREAFASYYKPLLSLTLKTDEMLAFEQALLRMKAQQQAAQQATPKDRTLQP